MGVFLSAALMKDVTIINMLFQTLNPQGEYNYYSHLRKITKSRNVQMKAKSCMARETNVQCMGTSGICN